MTKSIFLVALLLGTAVAPIAGATPTVPNAMVVAPDANAILAEIDRRADPFKDQSYNATMEIIKGGQLKKTLTFTATMKGLTKQLISFTGPGDVLGMKVLLDGTSIETYLPEFKKVRKVALHAAAQGFLGSTFYFEDMVEAKMSPHYSAEFGAKKGDITTLVLKPKNPESRFSKLECDIDKSKGGVTQIRYYDGSGNLVRQQSRSEWIKIEGHLIPSEVSMLDVKTGDLSVIKLSDMVVNQGVDDSVFTRRELLRG
jgi:outer membrane lipoprotein-sorting protein